MQASEIWLQPGERSLIVGTTGSGKSVMLQEQCRRFSHAPVVMLDTKIDDGFMDVPIDEEKMEVVESVADFSTWVKRPARKQPEYFLIRPNPREVVNPEIVDQYLRYCYEHLRKSLVVIDEAYQVHTNGRPGMGLVGLLTRGRSRGIATAMATQRPAWISQFCLTEATKFLVYFLSSKDDKRRLGQVTPYPIDLALDKYHFWGYKQGESDGTLFAPIPLLNDRGFVPEGSFLSHDWI